MADPPSSESSGPAVDLPPPPPPQPDLSLITYIEKSQRPDAARTPRGTGRAHHDPAPLEGGG